MKEIIENIGNREIKFRAWRENKLYPEDSFMFYNPEYTAYRECEDVSFANILEDNPIMMQFTGLKDKNGEEIYEGDIVTKDGKVNAEVIFDAPSFKVKVKVPYTENLLKGFGFAAGKEKFKFYETPLDCDVEVIGNVFENPELLKKK